MVLPMPLLTNLNLRFPRGSMAYVVLLPMLILVPRESQSNVIGTCWIGAFNVEVAHEVLGLPADVKPVAFTPLGYPDIQAGPKSRKIIDELVRYEHW